MHQSASLPGFRWLYHLSSQDMVHPSRLIDSLDSKDPSQVREAVCFDANLDRNLTVHTLTVRIDR